MSDFGPDFEIAKDVRPRLDSVDLLRGAVMVLMVLDHTRDYFSDATFDPTELARTNPALFMTRWVTHFCAPVFMFLAGASAYLSAARGKTRPELARFLFTRGLFLIILEFTIVKWGIFFNWLPTTLPAIVLWAIGCSMIALSALVSLPMPLVGAIGVAIVVGHNALDFVRPESLGKLAPLWRILHEGGLIHLPGGVVMFVGYPILPWIGVIACGFAFGPLLGLEPGRRRRVLLGLGLGLTLAFVALRATNLYGDPEPWSRQADSISTIFSFLRCQKYPPSLLYLLMTLGPAIAVLALLDGVHAPPSHPLIVFGRVPLFYYVLQWPLAHGLSLIVNAARGEPVGWLFQFPPYQSPPGARYDLPVVYLMWLVALVVLYPPCRWFAALKRRRKDAWLSYL